MHTSGTSGIITEGVELIGLPDNAFQFVSFTKWPETSVCERRNQRVPCVNKGFSWPSVARDSRFNKRKRKGAEKTRRRGERKRERGRERKRKKVGDPMHSRGQRHLSARVITRHGGGCRFAFLTTYATRHLPLPMHPLDISNTPERPFESDCVQFYPSL